MATITDLTECARPVYVEDPDGEDYPYGSLGSGFSVFYRNNYYFVTLAHVIGPSIPENLVIMVNDQENDLIPFNLLTGSRSPNIEESDIGDIRLLRIDNDLLTKSQLNSLCSLNLDKFRNNYRKPNPKDMAIITGYPAERKDVDFDKRRLKYQRFTIEGIVEGRSTEDYLYKVKLIKQDRIESMAGMSGSPVLILEETPNGKYDARFGGVVTRGGRSGNPRYAHFVEAAVVFNMLDKLEEEDS